MCEEIMQRLEDAEDLKTLEEMRREPLKFSDLEELQKEVLDV
jgi:hypothetical protein